MLFRYVRVSTKGQKMDLQIDALLKEGVNVKKIYSHIASGTRSERKGPDERSH